ncbi:YfcC family protein [Wenzhouxiangella limi]|uniref:Putative basic amino acid antiporter YfcC n=1 Tax=Wenzhouxiangella limi TaxID=2707351 RepID=A0A845UTV9_9GAMM|nr:AbgT family transporter [Wenzhouxiangella limi]NDY95263.1 putative basic amino acid antiporter YfcC [Wenzhouxiangella limi]
MTFRVPNTLALLFFLMVAALVATWVIPQGAFDTELNAQGREMVVPGSFEVVEERELMSPLELFTAVPRAFASASDIIFFLFIIGGVLAVIRATGTIDALLGQLLARFGTRPALLITAVIFVFALASSAIGSSGEYIPFVLILVALCRAMRMDPMTAVAMIVSGYGVGYGVAAFNPYTVVVAQGVAELPTYSGWPVRLALLVPFVLIAVHHVWSYAERVRRDPSASLVYDDAPVEPVQPPSDYPAMHGGHVAIVIGFFLALGTAVWGIATRGWYLNELGAAFLILGLAAAVIGGLGPSLTAEKFIQGAKELTETALLVGVARGIALIMEDGQILHTIVHYLSLPLSLVGAELSAVGMLAIQSLLNFFIPSGSGQAFVTMPLMAPLGDLVGVSRQVSVLAYQLGDGFTNMIIPTNAILMGILGMAGISYAQWLKFAWPLMLKLFAFAALTLIGAVWLDFQ